VDLGSFAVTLDGDLVIAIPHARVREGVDAAQELLRDELTPLLAALASEVGRRAQLAVTAVIRVDPAQPGRPIATRTVRAGTTMAIAGRPLDAEAIRRKFAWAQRDAIYRDLLELLHDARQEPNPRPIGFKIIERLNVKFGTGDAAVARELGMTKGDLVLVMRDQSSYEGDRHAQYAAGTTPSPLDPALRLQILAILERIVAEYERRHL